MGQKYAKTLKALHDNATTLKDCTWLTYEGLIKATEELNVILDDLTNSEGNDFQLLFAVSSSDNSYLWKAYVRIACCKIKKSTNAVVTEKVLDLARFCKVYRDLTSRYRCRINSEESTEDELSEDTRSELEQPSLTISMILSTVEAAKEEPVEECCICMERKSDVSLSCAHSYCNDCIRKWCGEHNSCPICRNKVAGEDDFWEMTEKPSDSEMANYVMGFSEATNSS